MRQSILASVVLVLATACATTPDPAPETIPSELSTVVPGLQRAWQGDDLSAYRPFYADNVVVEASGERYSGWNDVSTRWIQPALPAISEFRSTDLVFDRDGNDIIERGRYTFRLTTQGESQEVSGVFSQRWQRQADGTWKVVSVRVE